MRPMPGSHSISFHDAWNGLIHAVKTQPNFTIHLLLSIITISAGFWLRISSLEWIIISMTIAIGLVIELVNTAIESTVDLITRRHHRLAKIAKDTAAAAMLVYSIGAVVVAVMIFVPRLL